MVDVIILLFVLVLIIFAVKGSIRHFKGESPCCGGSSSSEGKKEKKLEGIILGEKDVDIGGMTCSNCALRVQSALNRIDGVSATVDLKEHMAHVRFTRLISDEEIKNAITSAGYEAGDIS